MISNRELISNLNKELYDVRTVSAEDIYQTFAQYVDNKQALKSLINYGDFYFEYAHYKKIFEGTLFEDGIKIICDMVNHVYEQNKKYAELMLVRSHELVSAATASYMQLRLTTSQKYEERNDLFYKQTFHVIGELIESSLKNYMRILSFLIENDNLQESISLGRLTDKLIGYHDVFWGLYQKILYDIKVSQWRNIADHCNYKISNDDVVVEYGPNDKRSVKRFSRNDILLVQATLDALLYMHRTAFRLIFIDHPDESFDSRKGQISKYVFHDSMLIQIVESVFALGCCVVDIDITKQNFWTIFVTVNANMLSDELLARIITVVTRILSCDYCVKISCNDVHKYEIGCRDGNVIVFQIC